MEFVRHVGLADVSKLEFGLDIGWFHWVTSAPYRSFLNHYRSVFELMQVADGLKERLRSERIRLKLSQDYCAKLVGVSLSTWKNWEKGQNVPADIFQGLISSGFNVVYILFGGDLVPTTNGYRIEEPRPDFVTPVTGGGAFGTSSSKNSLTTDTSEYPSNRGQSAASPDFVILRNCIEVLEERDSYRRLSPGGKAKAIVNLYELYLIEGKASRDLLDKRQA